MHYMMSCERLATRRSIVQGPGLETEPWVFGRKLTFEVPVPLIYTLEPGSGLPSPMYEGREPLIRQDLLDALLQAGVDNLDVYRATVRDPVAAREWDNYWAFNVLGMVAAGVGDAALAIDESKTKGLLLFRLAEVPSVIVVDEIVRQEVQRRAIPDMIFDPGALADGELAEQERSGHA
jgi:hypothetical protein